ncbi:hypothetical protein C6T60_05805 [Burkholderia multivorans]|nr:hypothetical protein C6T60_05805 [Burkholderia multivorans]
MLPTRSHRVDRETRAADAVAPILDARNLTMLQLSRPRPIEERPGERRDAPPAARFSFPRRPTPARAAARAIARPPGYAAGTRAIR